MIAILLVTAIVVYLGLCFWMARTFLLKDDDVETLLVDLPDSVGQQIALYHHPSSNQRFLEPIVLCPGLGATRFNMDFLDDGQRSDRLSLARTLARAGFDTWVFEPRGRGRVKLPPQAEWTVDQEVAEDVPLAISTILNMTSASHVFWVGHSMGGILQYLFQARGHELADRVRGMVAVASPGTLRPQQRVFRAGLIVGRLFANLLHRPVPLVLLAKLGLPLAGVIYWCGRWFAPTLAGMNGPILRRLFASLPGDISCGVMRQLDTWVDREGSFAPDGVPDADRFDDIRLPLLLISGSRDFLAPFPAMKYVEDRVGSTDVTLRLMGKGSGCRADYGHGGLLLSKHAPDEVFPIIKRWLVEHATAYETTRTHSKSNGSNGTPTGWRI